MRKGKMKGTLRLIMATAMLTVMTAGITRAGVVQPSGAKSQTDHRDINNIEKEMAETGTATLVSGATYNLPRMIHMKSGYFLDATGATLICSSNAVNNMPTKTNYQSFKNVHIKGGTWKQDTAKGFDRSSFQFVHGQGLILEDMTILCTNYVGHAIELIACKDVVINNCKIIAQGKNPSNNREEMIQIDVAAPATAPTIATRYGNKMINGGICKNVTISNCVVKGAKAVCANYAARDGGKWLKNFHSKIVVTNCTLTGVSGQALNLANCLGVTISGCTIKTTMKTMQTSFYSDGCTIFFNGTAPKALKSAVYTVTNNKIYGGRHALAIGLSSSAKAKSIKVTGNKLYCRSGKGNALSVSSSAAKKVVTKGNKTAKW